MLMIMMAVLLGVSVIFLVITLVTLRPQGSTVIVGYGDVYMEIAGLTKGYRWESWLNMLAFPALALVFGGLHNVIAVKMYQRYGKEAAMVFVALSILLVVGALTVLFRVLGEW